MVKLRLLSMLAVVAGMVLGMSAFTLGGNNAEASSEDDIRATLQAIMQAWNAGDVDTFMSYWLDEGLAYQFPTEDGQTQKEAVEAAINDTGPIASIEVTDVFAPGGNATGIVDLKFEAGFSLYEKWDFEFSGGMWKIGAGTPASRPIPPGVPAVDLSLQEYAFNYNPAAIQAADGNFAFKVTNVGQQEHEVVLLKIDSDKPLLDLLQSADPESEDLPQGLEFAQFGGVFAPGTSGTVIFDQPLSNGRYGLVCFLPSPEGVPHAFLGMVSEFDVGQLAPSTGGDSSSGGITPPSTGDAGLLHQDGGTTTWLMLALATMLVLGGTAGLVKSVARPNA